MGCLGIHLCLSFRSAAEESASAFGRWPSLPGPRPISCSLLESGTGEAKPMTPLAHRRILITRPPQQASELAGRLRALGATPISIPTIEIAPPASFAALDAALASLSSFDVVAFTSANAVTAFQQRARLLGIVPQPRRIAVVGPS